MRKRGLSVGFKLSVFLLFIVLICSVVIGVFSYFVLHKTSIEEKKELARLLALSFANSIDGDLYEKTITSQGKNEYWYQVKEMADRVKKETDVAWLYIVDAYYNQDVVRYFATGYKPGDEIRRDFMEEDHIDVFGSEMFDTLRTGQPFVSDVYDSGEYGSMISGYAAIFNSAGKVMGVVGFDIYANEVFATSRMFARNIIRFILAFCVIFIVASIIFLNRVIIRSLKRLSQAMELVAKGDLTVGLQMAGQDEVVRMANNMNQTIQTLQHSVSGMKQISARINDFSENLSDKTQHMSMTTEEVTTAIQIMAQGATKQTTDLIEVLETLGVFSKEIYEIDNNVNTVQESSHMAVRKAMEGRDQVELLATSITSISKTFRTFMETISSLGLSVNKISIITDAINAISDQTNLLALNANIEAARAGEQGKGFTVVASEVRKLATESKKSSEEIMELIHCVSQETQSVIKASQEVNDLLNDQEKVISKMVELFKMISSAVEIITPLVKSTHNSVSKAVEAKDNVVSHVEEVATISKEFLASVEEIVASSEQLLSFIKAVSNVASEMNHSAYDLIDWVKMYKTECIDK